MEGQAEGEEEGYVGSSIWEDTALITQYPNTLVQALLFPVIPH